MLLAVTATGGGRMGSLQGYPCLSRWSTAMYLQAAQVDSVDFKGWESEGREEKNKVKSRSGEREKTM